MPNENASFETKAAGFDTTRVQALTDGIFAFAMTLLVLDLREISSDAGDFWQLTSQMLQKLFYYFLSFLILGVFWTGHHAEFHYLRKTNRVHLWMNIFLLMTIATIPYTTTLLTRSPNRLFAVVIYGSNITLTTIAYLVHWHYATSQHRLSISQLPDEIILDVKKRLIVSNILLVLSLALSLWNEMVSLSMYILVQLYYIFKTTRTKTGIPD